MSKHFVKIIFAFSGGILMGLSVAPFNLFFLAWIALIPLWIIIRKSQSFPLFSALAWGCGYHGFALFWITGIHPMTWMGVPWLNSLLIAIFVWLFITLWGASLVIIWTILFKSLQPLKKELNSNNNYTLLGFSPNFFYDILNIILGVALWCILEKIWSFSPLWWTSLSLSQSPNNLAILQLLIFSGTTTITGLIVAVNGFLAESLIKLNDYFFKHKTRLNILSFLRNFNLGLIAIILFISSHILGYFLYHQPIIKPINQQIKVGIIQGNIPNQIKLYPEGWRKAIEGYTQGYQILAKQKVDVILTPETALPFYYDDLKSNSSFYQALLTEKIPTWLGAFGENNHNFTNSLFTLNGEGKIISRYDKINLVPLGEYIPFYSILGNIINRLSPLDAHLIAGEKNQIFHTPFGQAIVGICYDSAFSEHFRRQAALGGEFIITASNNAHYSSNMPAQHHAQDVMRTIETNRWNAKATNTGYSGIIDPHGNTIWLSKLNKYELYEGNIYRRQTKTLYVKWGDWLTKIFGLFLLIYLLSRYITL